MDRPNGLTSQQARVLLAQHGPNEIQRLRGSSRLRRLLRPLTDPMVLLLLAACPVYLAVGETTDAVTAIAAVAPIMAIGWYLEGKANRGIERLQQLNAPTATVIRDGVDTTIAAREIVVGDVVRLREGDIVPADGHIIESERITLNESSLTGEAMPVDKRFGDDVAASTVVTAGTALVSVTATGSQSALGRISQLMANTTPPHTRLQQAMGRLVVRVAIVAALGTLVVMTAEAWRGHGWQATLIAGISLLIAAVPEEFSMVYALYLSIGAWYLARHKALVRTLPSAEALGSVTVICTDKTGTVTEGRLRVAAMHPVTSTERLIEDALLASERNPYDPLDSAIATHAQAHSVSADDVYSGELLDDWPFRDNRVTRVWRLESGTIRVACKGSLEALLELTGADETQRIELEQAHGRMAVAGLRVIAVASAQVPATTGDRVRDEDALTMDGLIGFEDPLRLGVADAVAECLSAGIRVVMITGDHPDTARAIAQQMSETMVSVTTGAELDSATPEQLADLVAKTDVFARTKPIQKHALVLALQERGEVVAMTGDGVNDAPALRTADIGVAMGSRGTAVARDAAAVVLLEDDFGTIVSAIRNGRRIYDNLARAFGYLIAVHLPIILSAAVVPLFGLPLLLQPTQLVLLEVLLHPVVSLVFQSDPAAPDTMIRPPRSADHALTWRALRPAVILGLSLSIGVLAVYQTALHLGWQLGTCRAVAFATLVLAQPPLLLVLRASHRGQWRIAVTREFVIAVVACVALAASAVGIPVLARLNHFAPVTAAGWLLAGVVALASVVLPRAAVN